MLFAKKLKKIRQIWPRRSLKHFTAAYRGFPPCTQSQPPINRATGIQQCTNILVTVTSQSMFDYCMLVVTMNVVTITPFLHLQRGGHPTGHSGVLCFLPLVPHHHPILNSHTQLHINSYFHVYVHLTSGWTMCS